ncbi:MAG: AhpC/TSA family protein [Muribaculaceae bacterium]|nr:AhpC/TSA family protein [Muribaculaceae bacterium]
MRKIFLTALAAMALTAVAEPFKVIAPLGEDFDGAMVRLVDFDTEATIDSVLVADGTATFTGDIDEAVLARVVADGVRNPVFILESGTVSFGKDGPFGTMLNDQLRELMGQLSAIQAAYQQTSDAAEREALPKRYEALLDSTMTANNDNAFGYYIFLNGDASMMTATQLREELSKYPSFAKGRRVQKMLAAAENREATQPGGKYLDFEVTYDGRTERLSDYVGRGKYTLVDFWASWCGPCIRQTPVIKGLYEKYKDKGLDVLGVAVWDEPDNTKAAIEKHGITWPCIINAGTIPTDLYGISGIPCIILFGPDGTILSRDKQGDELVADVDAAMASAAGK